MLRTLSIEYCTKVVRCATVSAAKRAIAQHADLNHSQAPVLPLHGYYRAAAQQHRCRTNHAISMSSTYQTQLGAWSS